jgi:glycosyltransferase involved in cell wall biosynthesis
MRIVIDYRPALRARSGVGEAVHQTARALALRYPDDVLTLFTSSWKDRPDPATIDALRGTELSDHRLPVRLLNFTWHRFEWPSIELLTGKDYDVAFSPHPLLLPARDAAQVVMVHDLDFLRHPERTQREIRRDYPALAGPHARRAHRVIVPSKHTAADVIEQLGVPSRQVVVCPHGVPSWRDPAPMPLAADGYVLFMGTLESRKNVDGLLDAYGRLLARRPNAPNLVLAGSAGPEAGRWLDAIVAAPLAGHVEHIGYVGEPDRQRVYMGARVLVLPSHEEGFGMPALEAMSLGIPVIASNRGALPEVLGETGILVAPDDTESIVAALDRLLADDELARAMGRRGFERAQQFQWSRTAEAVREAFSQAMDERAAQSRGGRSAVS